MAVRKKINSTTAKRARNLLLELGTEELPPKALKALGESFARGIYSYLVEAGVAKPGKDQYQFYASPRRLAVWVKQVSPCQTDQIAERKGPSVQAGFDEEGKPTRAALGFAQSCGVKVEQLDRESTDKGEWLFFRSKQPGKKIAPLVTEALEQALKKLPIPKRMRWGNGSQEFVRPVHWLLALYGSDLLPVAALGLNAEPWTRGHRSHAPRKIRILSADRYLNTLKTDGFVIADFIQRRSLIERQVKRLATRAGATPVIDPDLLDEVTSLVEWPSALYGEFDKRFLKVPAEVLVSSMSDHQKYFHLTDTRGKLVPGFITVSNIRSAAPKRVKSGNERVLRARLADAEFFWLSDQKQNLIERKPRLDSVLFHKKLGSVLAKVERVRVVAQYIADQTNADASNIDRACDLSKADLVTDMVAEFPELQGTIGGYYAANQGENKEVCEAIKEHYLPRAAGDSLPRNGISRSLAIADRIDTVTGIFASGETPSGDKDPYGLRRASLGILRILIESGLNLDLSVLVALAMEQYRNTNFTDLDTSKDTERRVRDYIYDRLKAYYQPLGFDPMEIASVVAVAPTRPLDFNLRLKAVHDFFSSQRVAAESLAAANKRIANILVKQKEATGALVNPELFIEPAEIALAKKVTGSSAKARQYFAQGEYSKGLLGLAKLKAPIDDFFDSVMVMDENVDVRNNRLSLLTSIRGLFLEVADISYMRVE